MSSDDGGDCTTSSASVRRSRSRRGAAPGRRAVLFGAFAPDFIALATAFATRFTAGRRAGRAAFVMRRARFGVFRAGFERFRVFCAFRLAMAKVLSDS
jgi:hypothetical protein